MSVYLDDNESIEYERGNLRGAVANELDSDIVVSSNSIVQLRTFPNVQPCERDEYPHHPNYRVK